MKKGFVKELLASYVLNEDDVHVIAIRPTKTTDLVQLVFAQHVNNPNRTTSLLGEQMRGHESFSGTGIRAFWVNFTLDSLRVNMPQLVDLATKAIETGDYVKVDLDKPVVPVVRNKPVAIQLTETLVASKSDMNNIEISAKSNGQGEYLYVEIGSEKNLIFTRTDLEYASKLDHTFIEHDGKSSDLAELTVAQQAVSASEDAPQKAQQSQKEIVDDEETSKEEVTASA